MSWWRRHWRLILIGVVIALAIIALLTLYVVRRKKEAEELRSELLLLKAGAKVQGLKADKEARQLELMQNAKAKAALDKEITLAKKEAIAILKDVSKMSELDIAMEFKKLGY
jgi:hypothetical protein